VHKESQCIHHRRQVSKRSDLRFKLQRGWRMVIASEVNSSIDHNTSLVDMGLDWLESTERVPSFEI